MSDPATNEQIERWGAGDYDAPHTDVMVQALIARIAAEVRELEGELAEAKDYTERNWQEANRRGARIAKLEAALRAIRDLASNLGTYSADVNECGRLASIALRSSGNKGGDPTPSRKEGGE